MKKWDSKKSSGVYPSYIIFSGRYLLGITEYQLPWLQKVVYFSVGGTWANVHPSVGARKAL